MLDTLTDQTLRVLAIDGAGVSLAGPDGRLKFVTATDEPVVRLEEQQTLAGEGPCHDARATGHPVCAEDLEDDDHWPAYRDVALQQGADSCERPVPPAHPAAEVTSP